jgi:anti-sigma regulatory factor (Ser/Thr protein kinase)
MNAARGLVLPVTEVSQVGEARRQATALAQDLGFPESVLGRLALIVTEAAGNLVKHATAGGELVVRVVEQEGGVRGIEVLSLDQAPGMADVGRSMQDGHSTAGSPGTGLGAISRLADDFQIYSAPGLGTGLMARLWVRPSPATLPPPHLPLEVGVVNLSMPGEEVCGDGWAVRQRGGRCLVLVVDGLGHGFGAAEASRAAVETFRTRSLDSPAEVVEALHGALHGTRGAAVAVVEIDMGRRKVHFAGIGNISGSIHSPDGSQSMVSHHGIVGHQIRKVQEFSYDWPEEALLVLHSDGLTERWNLTTYPGLATRDVSLVAGILYRDYARRTDDATVLVAREAARR